MISLLVCAYGTPPNHKSSEKKSLDRAKAGQKAFIVSLVHRRTAWQEFQVCLGSERCSDNIWSEPERSKPVRVRLAQAVLRNSETTVPKKNLNARKKTVETRLGALRTDLGALQAEVKNGVGDVGDVAGERAGAVVQSAGELAERALRLAEETAMDWAGDVEDWTSDNVESARDTVRAQPLAAIALAVGAGALIGAIFLRR